MQRQHVFETNKNPIQYSFRAEVILHANNFFTLGFVLYAGWYITQIAYKRTSYMHFGHLMKHATCTHVAAALLEDCTNLLCGESLCVVLARNLSLAFIRQIFLDTTMQR